jgi:hypothetical protein
MIRTIVTIAAAGLALFSAASVANADVISESTSTESAQVTTNEGTSNSAEDHMAGTSNDGNLEGDTPGTVWKVIKRTPRVDENGDPVLGSNGLQIIDLTWGSVPVGSGPAPAEIIHN